MANTLWEYYSQKGQQLPSVQERRSQFDLGPKYMGTAAQNTALLGQLKSGQVSTPTPRPAPTPTPAPAPQRQGMLSPIAEPATQRQGMLSPIAEPTYGPPAPLGNLGFVQGTPANLMAIISSAADKYGIPTSVLSALLKQESGFNLKAKSPVGGEGIAQFMPATAKQYGVDPWDATSSINGAAKYLANMMKQYNDMNKALAAYNAGPGAVNKYKGIPPFKETQNYVKSINAMVKTVKPSVVKGVKAQEPKEAVSMVEGFKKDKYAVK